MLDFPGPGGLTLGQVFTSAGKSWQWDGAKWGPAAGGGAPLDSPSFTGDPKAPTPSTGDNDTSIATTAFVKAQAYLTGNQSITLSGDIAGAGTTAIVATLATVNADVGAFQGLTLDAKGRVTAAANQGYQTASQVTAALAPYAPLAAPVFTGDPKAPTPATADNDTSIATTAFVKAQGYLLGNQTVTLSGDLTGSGTTAITATLATVNANVGTFQGLTVDAKGRVTAAANQNYVTGGPYLPTAGGQTTGAVGVNTPIAAGGQPSNFYAGALQATNLGFNIYLNAAPAEWRRATGSGFGGLISFNTALGEIDFFTNAAGTAGSTITLTPVAIITAGGDYTIMGSVATKPGGGSWVAPSDVRLKTSVAPYETGLAAIVQLQPVTYEYNGEAGMPTGKTFHGIIADDAVVAMPETVGRAFLSAAPEEAPTEYLTFDSTPLTYALLNAIKELTARVAELEARLPPEAH